MKTYILSILDSLKQINETLDAKAALYNKSWLVFNDTGIKEVYIFQKDGTLLDSVNGRVIEGSWQYIKENRTLLISIMGNSYMFHPLFMDDIVLALQMDGTKECCFMIDESNAMIFLPKTLNELNEYLQEKVLNFEYESQQEKEQKDKWQKQQQEKEEIENLLKHDIIYTKYISRDKNYAIGTFTAMISSIFIPLILYYYEFTNSVPFLTGICILCIVLAAVFLRLSFSAEKQANDIKKKVIEKYHKSKT